MYLIQPETPPTRTRRHSPSLRPNRLKQAVPLLRRMISFALAVGASYRMVFYPSSPAGNNAHFQLAHVGQHVQRHIAQLTPVVRLCPDVGPCVQNAQQPDFLLFSSSVASDTLALSVVSRSGTLVIHMPFRSISAARPSPKPESSP